MTTAIRAQPIRGMTQAEFDLFFSKAASILLGNVDHSGFRGYVFVSEFG